MVVATRDRAGRLRALLDSLAGQHGVAYEVVVVDDGSRDGTPGVVAEAAERLPVRIMRHESPRGPAAARNAGWRLARAPLVVFVDDDCVAESGWLAALVEAHRREPRALMQGCTEPHPVEAHRQSAFSRSMLVDRLGPWFQACNIAYPRALLERVGGFHEGFGTPAGEDTDLALRARKSGAPVTFVPDAVVHHAVHRLGALRLARSAGRWSTIPLLVKRHPELRAEMPGRVFWRPSHQRLALAACGALMAGRSRGLSLALAAPYLTWARTQHGSYAGVLASLPAHLLVDLAEIAALARGSVRARTLLI